MVRLPSPIEKRIPVLDEAYRRDFYRRTSPAIRPRNLVIASHLVQQPSLGNARPILSAMESGKDFAQFLSPMEGRKKAFKTACTTGNWSRYKRVMDQILNKWGFYHFHSDGGRELLFAHLPDWSNNAFIIDIVAHNRNWKVEKRLVGIVVENWPEAGIAIRSTVGKSTMTEGEHFDARARGVNLPVEVEGVFYTPGFGGLMSDGSAFANIPYGVPIAYVGVKHDPTSNPPERLVDSPNLMVVGVDKGDPTPPWLASAGQAGLLAKMRRERFVASQMYYNRRKDA